ncbi:MAG TPA: PDZ domain-containing protein [Pyrinomonadaceae bacterium]|nr:PDZ domain-containing protein [Pyrinomonadaceae bacterium]
MKAKYSLSLLAVIILAAGSALAQQTPPPAPEPPDEPFDQNFEFSLGGDGFLGVYAENISSENMGRYHMNQVRGVGVTRIVKDSPAEKAGLRKDDVILRVDGENISSVRKLNRIVSELAPDQSVKITVSRGGSEQEITATIAKRSNKFFAGDFFKDNPKMWKWESNPRDWKFKMTPRVVEVPHFNLDGNLLSDGDLLNNRDLIWLANGRRIGVGTVELTKQLADFFGVAGGKGVLVTAVTDDGPAAKAGLRAGDVITAVDGEAIDSPGDISRVINRKKEGDVTLTVFRNKSQQTIRVTPREGGFSGAGDRPQVGRRIVIPRIEIPTMPSIEIGMPSITIPSIPAVNIQMPPIRISPRVRVIRSERGPI